MTRCNAARSTISIAVLARATRAALICTGGSGSNARVTHHQENVSNQISADHEKRGEHDAPHDDEQVTRKGSVEDERAEAGPSADHFDKQRSADQTGQ